jgi:hypothetical protein
MRGLRGYMAFLAVLLALQFPERSALSAQEPDTKPSPAASAPAAPFDPAKLTEADFLPSCRS